MKNIKEYAKENGVPIIQDGGLDFLKKIVVDNGYKSILELGTAIGFSSISLAQLNDDIEIDTIEKKEAMFKQAIANVQASGLDDRIHCYYGRIEEFETEKIYDLIFVDAAKAQYMKYLEQFIDNISENGIFVFDNIVFHGLTDHPDEIKNRNTRQLVKKIITFKDEILSDDRFESNYYPNVGDGIITLRKKGK